MNRLAKYLAHPAAVAARQLAAELAVGLGGAWLALVALELIRRGMVSLYIDLNMLLAAAVIAWLVGEKPQPTKRWHRYVSAAILAILLALVAWRLSEGGPWHAYAPLLGLAALLTLVP